MIDSQQFLNKLEELKKSDAKPKSEWWLFLKRWLCEGKSKKEVAEALEASASTVSRRLTKVCQYFHIKVEKGGLHEDDLVNLFHAYYPDFLHSSIRHGVIDDDRPKPPTNPENIFTPETIDPNFVGRTNVLVDVDRLFERHRLVLMLGEGGLGKSTVARFYGQRFQFKDFCKLGTTYESEVTSAESLVDKWLKEFFGEEISRQEFRIKLDRLRKYLENDERCICFVLDNLEPALVNGNFKSENKQYVDLLEVLSDPLIRSRTLITSREPISENSIRVRDYKLPKLDARSWYEYFQSYDIQISEESLSETATNSAIKDICKDYGGNAACMALLCGDILKEEQYGNDLEAYWNANKEDLLRNPTIEGLVKRQFERLQRDSLWAYHLLCRMGCYRYQNEVSAVPEKGIIELLWEDEAKPSARSAFTKLCDLCLIKFSAQDKGYFLHPVMRAEAVNRLKDGCDKWTEEGIKANQKAAEFWTKSIDVITNNDDALRAFEAYHHYIAVNEYQLAADVIVTERKDHLALKTPTPLGTSMYEFGILADLKDYITKVIEYVLEGASLSRLYNILGDVCWLTGNIGQAIESHNNCKEIAIKFNLPKLITVSFFNIGLCQIELWDIELAVVNFEKCVETSEDTDYNYYAIGSYFCLSFLYSVLVCKDKAINFAHKGSSEIKKNTLDHSRWSIGYRWLFLGKTYLNLEDLEESSKMYNKALTFAREIHYQQVEANALSGLASIARKKKDFKKSISCHNEAIKILKKIGANPDLAEAHFQFGLTYQAMGEHDQVAHFAEYHKNKALKLFEQMEARKQIDRVNKDFEQGAMK